MSSVIIDFHYTRIIPFQVFLLTLCWKTHLVFVFLQVIFYKIWFILNILFSFLNLARHV